MCKEKHDEAMKQNEGIALTNVDEGSVASETSE